MKQREVLTLCRWSSPRCCRQLQHFGGLHRVQRFSRFTSKNRRSPLTPKPPVPPKANAKDPFQWMEDVEDVRVKQYMRRENDHTDAVLKDGKQVRKFRKRIQNEVMSWESGETEGDLPEKSGKYLYYSAQHPDRNGVVFYRCLAKHDIDDSHHDSNNSVKGNNTMAKKKKNRRKYELPKYLHVDKESEQVLLDESELASELNTGYALLGTIRISPDHKYLAYTVDLRGDESYIGRVRPIGSATKGQAITQELTLQNALAFSWGADKEERTSSEGKRLETPCIFYTVANELRRASRVYKMTLGKQTPDSELVFREDDHEDCFLDLHNTKDNALVTIGANRRDDSEVYVMPSVAPLHSPSLVWERQEGVQYFVEHRRGWIYIITNANNAYNFQVLRAKLPCRTVALGERLLPTNWEIVIPHDRERKIEDVDIFKDHIVIYGKMNMQPFVEVHSFNNRMNPKSSSTPVNKPDIDKLPFYSLDTNHIRHLELSEDACEVFPGANNDFNAKFCRICVASTTCPERVYDFRFDKNSSGTSDSKSSVFSSSYLLRQVQLGECSGWPSFDESLFTSYRLWARSAKRHDVESLDRIVSKLNSGYYEDDIPPCEDHVNVPITLVHRKGVPLTGHSPTLMHAYGAYGQNLSTELNIANLSLLYRGWVLAFAHVRGGGELGSPWYHDGRLNRKYNSFGDTVASVQTLFNFGITKPQLLALKTESAGGVIGGWMANNCGSLIQSCILKVPFLDVSSAMHDDSLPLTIAEHSEWGDPLRDEPSGVRDMIQNYCPYTNCGENTNDAKVAPCIYMTGARKDPRVPVYHPLKFLGKLRHIECTPISTKTENEHAYICKPRHSSRPSVYSEHQPSLLEMVRDWTKPMGGDYEDIENSFYCHFLRSSVDVGGHFGEGGKAAQIDNAAEEIVFLHLALGLPLE